MTTFTLSLFEKKLPWFYGDGDCKNAWLVKLSENGKDYIGLYSPWQCDKATAEKWLKRLRRSKKEREFLKLTDILKDLD